MLFWWSDMEKKKGSSTGWSKTVGVLIGERGATYECCETRISVESASIVLSPLSELISHISRFNFFF
ncbi:hypothetical protein PGIGA_G00251170 [Pangasianodon gigas]|uniref:Uncharacterized protein n=1 Tax=Pangasianodon gigas TaxID=30993 RepID=A0ACC5WQM5_PANGG|nr:hypothetical protein [Pangasianodon gigas]